MGGELSSVEWVSQKNKIKEEIKHLILYKMEGYRLRGKVKWMEDGEGPSRFFHQLIKARQTQSAMVKVRCRDGSTVSNPDSMLREVRMFYQNLYSKGKISEESQEEILEYVGCTLSLSQQESLEKPISLLEVLGAIGSASEQSSPGKDGIPYKFYKVFKKEVAPILVQLYNEVLGGKSFSSSALESVIILIFKKKGSVEELKNWRPISLLNCDLKLLTKILAKRLQEHISSIIHEDQAGFVSSRHIQDKCMMLNQLLEYNRISPTAGALYFLDQEKAYDRVDWAYMEKCLRKYGFGPRWVHLIGVLYGKLKGRVLVNGFLSVTFDICQGVRQGDPLSPLLFNIIIEPLLSCLHYHIRELSLPGLTFKTSAFADDIL
jgi:hypothetical protein